MRSIDCLATSLLAVWLGGCASAPEQAVANAAPATVEPQAAAASSNVAELEPVVVDLAARDLDPGLAVTCQEMLRPGSNMIVKTCMTPSEWRRFRELEARSAGRMVRQMQGDRSAR